MAISESILKNRSPVSTRRALARLHPRRIAHRLWKMVFRKQFLSYRGLKLPPKDLRGRMCGEAFRSDEFFLQSGVVETLRLVKLGYTKESKIVDIGSGLGRLATGMIWEFGDAPYLGLEVNPEFISWCQKHISSDHPSYRFVHLDIENERYNPNGKINPDAVELPIASGGLDIVYMWGVFTNIAPEHVLMYTAEISRVLRSGGKGFLTAFVEENVPDVSFNPEGYGPYVHDGSPLLVVRYSKKFLFDAFDKNGLTVEEFRHHGGGFPYQSELYLRKR